MKSHVRRPAVSPDGEERLALASTRDRLKLLTLLESLARAANEAISPEAAMDTCLAQVCDYGKWRLGRVVVFNVGLAGASVEDSRWYGQDLERFAPLMRLSRGPDYASLHGRFINIVLRKKEPVWIADLTKVRPLGSLKVAIDTGLRSAFAFPIVVQGEVAAFLEFLAEDPRKVDRSLFHAVGSIGAQLARLIERQRADEEHVRLASIVESSQDAIIATAPDGTIVTWNAGAKHMFGYRAAEVIGQHISLLFPDDRRQELLERRPIALAGKYQPPHESERVTKDGRRLAVSASISPLKDKAENVIGVTVIYRDISELKRAAWELDRRARLSGLMESLARAANEAVTAEAAMETCLKIIHHYGGWTLGCVVMFSYGRARGIPRATNWYPNDVDRFKEFIANSQRTYHSVRRGRFTGRVLREKAPVWLPDLSTMTRIGRIQDAVQTGFKSAFAFPVVVNDEPAAFLEFFADEFREPDTLLLDTIRSVGAQLGRLIERGRAEAERAQLAAIVEHSEDAIISRDLQRRILTWNAAAERLYGYKAEEVVGRNIAAIAIPPDQDAVASRDANLVQSGQLIPAYDTVRLTKDGRRIDVSVLRSPIKDVTGKVTGASLIIRDISERKRAEEKIRQLALYDALTGLPNRALFRDLLQRAMNVALRERCILALMYADLDRFKLVNDTLGHDAGDAVLKEAADRIRGCLRQCDTVARIGGDEFLAILPAITHRNDVAAVAEKVVHALSVPFSLGNSHQRASIGASIGIAIYPEDARDMDTLIKAADQAMYVAKERRNSIVVYPRP